MRLKVYRSSVCVGMLDMAPDEPFYGFSYDAAYMAQPDALPLSISLPLDDRRYSGEEALPFFEGLLPEGNVRYEVARRLGVSPKSPSKLLH